MARCKQDGTDWQQALQQMRATPLDKDLPSPAEILHGRPIRTAAGQAQMQPVDIADVKRKLELKQQSSVANYNKRHKATDLPPLHVKENILIQHRDGNWEPATVTQVCNSHR